MTNSKKFEVLKLLNYQTGLTHHYTALPSFRVAEILGKYLYHPLDTEDAAEDAGQAHVSSTAASFLSLLHYVDVHTSWGYHILISVL